MNSLTMRRKTAKLFKKIAKIMAPPPNLTVSEWADQYRKLSAESSAEPGQWNTDRAPYQRAILNATSDRDTEVVIIQSSAQVGKTEIINNVIGYHIDYDPSPIMVLVPTVDLAKSFSKKRLAPMIRDTPVLAEKIQDSKSRDSDNTILEKGFPGGYVVLVGANSPSNLASRPIRILLADEVDRYPLSAGKEGDPLGLAEKRTKTFFNKKKVYVSTPTEKETSRIHSEYLSSTMEEWCLPCPYCGRYQTLMWSQIRFEDVTMECKYCGEHASEYDWKSGVGKWVSQKPEASKARRGFHLNALASPWERWETIISEFKDAKKKGKEVLKTWVNTYLGEPWEDQDGEMVAEDKLLSRREAYNCEVPEEVLVLTAGVDVQDDRLEVEVVGWSIGKESWGIEYSTFVGDPGQNIVWSQLDRYLQKEFHYPNGDRLLISATCIDSGGHHTDDVYSFCKVREHKRIYAIKGKGGAGIPFIHKFSRNNKQNVLLFILGVDSGKETLLSRLKVEFEKTAGYCHFPIEEEKGYNQRYFKALTSERKVIRYYKGQRKIEWKKKGKRNEALDIRNYATAALEILNPDLEDLKQRNMNGNVYQQARVKKKKKRKLHSKGIS